MDPIIAVARESLTQGWLMGGMTFFFFSSFLGWTLWAWWPGNRETLEAAAHMPLDEASPAGGQS